MAAVAVVGAGVAGLTAAYRLKRRGIRVVVYEVIAAADQVAERLAAHVGTGERTEGQ